MNVSFPAHRLHGKPDRSRAVAVLAVGERASRELPQDVVQPVDRLHRCGGIEERRIGERALGDVDEQPDAVGDIFVERRLERRDQGRVQPILSQTGGLPEYPEKGRAGRDKLAERGDELQFAAARRASSTRSS